VEVVFVAEVEVVIFGGSVGSGFKTGSDLAAWANGQMRVRIDTGIEVRSAVLGVRDELAPVRIFGVEWNICIPSGCMALWEGAGNNGIGLWDENPRRKGTGSNLDVGVRLEVNQVVVGRLCPLKQVGDALMEGNEVAELFCSGWSNGTGNDSCFGVRVVTLRGMVLSIFSHLILYILKVS
jgi:hypothetical protein